MRVLGVDPGLTRCGLGAVEGARAGRSPWSGVGVVRTPRDADVGQRLLAIEQAHRGVAGASTRPDVGRRRAGVQPAQRPHRHGHRPGRGGRVLAAARAGIPVALHTPSEVKAAVTGSGRADKEQVGGDGHAAPAAARGADAGRRRRRPRPRDLPPLADGTASAAATARRRRHPAQRRWVEAAREARGRRRAAPDRPPRPVHGPSRHRVAFVDPIGGPHVIASVRGRVLAVRLDAAVVEVGGVGMLVQATPATLAALRLGERGASWRRRWSSGRTR